MKLSALVSLADKKREFVMNRAKNDPRFKDGDGAAGVLDCRSSNATVKPNETAQQKQGGGKDQIQRKQRN